LHLTQPDIFKGIPKPYVNQAKITNMLALIVTLLSLLGFIVVFRRRRSLNVPLPPSPPSDFILGHLRHIPSENPEIQYAEWAKIYGEIFFSSSFVLLARTH
jgi:hypothetical protein